MLRLTEVASQSVTFVKPALRKAKTNTLNSINEMDGPSGHYRVVFSLDRPPLLAVRRRGTQRYVYCNSLRRPSRGSLSSCRPVASSGQTAPGHEAVLPCHPPTQHTTS